MEAYRSCLEELTRAARDPDPGTSGPDGLRDIRDRVPGAVDAFPLSPLQQGLLFETLLDTDRPAYMVQTAVTLEGELDPELLRAAWQKVLDRHDSLRCAMLVDRDPPLQVVCEPVTLPWTQLDWRAEGDEGLSDWLEADRGQGFDPVAPPMLRLTLIRTGEQRWVMVLTLHHVLVDGWSMPILFREVVAIYEALRVGRAVELPAPPSYGKHIAHLSSWTRSKAWPSGGTIYGT